ncbi:hypothetical protein GCM10022198_09310 [Klugiella xanthotipulae]
MVRGTAEANTTVTIRDADGTILGTTPSDSTGRYELPFTPSIPDGTVLMVTSTDAAGNVSLPATTTVNNAGVDAPVVNPTDGTEVTGNGVPGNTITVTLPDSTELTTTVKPDGTWTVPVAPGHTLTDGETVTVVQTNPEGTHSQPVTVVVDQTAPEAIDLNPTNGTQVTGGTVDPTDTVTWTNGSGTVIPGVTTINPDGTVRFVPTTPLPHGTVVTATPMDAAGNVGAPASVTVDAQAPAAPTVNPTNGSVVRGTAEANTTVTIRDADGTILGTTPVDAAGTYELAFSPWIPDGTVLLVTSTDAAGNVSQPATTTVNNAPVDAPVVNPTDGTEVTGNGVPGNTITVTLPDSTELTTTVKPDGTWTVPVAPGHTLTDGETVTVIATNPEGTDSAPVAVIVDQTPPAPAVTKPSNGSTVVIEPIDECDTATVVDGNGTPILGELTVNPDGTITFVPEVPLTEDDTVLVIVTDPSGNVSTPTPVEIDTTAPEAPTVNPTNGSVVRGTAEPNTTVTITDSDGTILGTTLVDANGLYELPFSPAIPDGTVLLVTATDGVGNVSLPATTRVDGSAVLPPYVAPTTGETLTGTALPGGTITATLPDGTELTTTVKPDGTWTIPVAPGHTLTEGDTVSVTVENSVGTVSEPTIVVVDQTAPKPPLVNPTDGTVVTGSGAEPGGTVIVTDKDGRPIDGEATVNPDGTFRFVPTTPLPDGELIEVIVTDPAGNRSEPTPETVDHTAPTAPVVDPTDGTRVTGTAEPGSKITVRDESGRVIGTGTTGPDGRFDIGLSPAAAPGSRVAVSATDAAGNIATTIVTVNAAGGAFGATEATDGRAGSLALTGSAGIPATAVLALLGLVSGAALVVLRRRRDARDELSSETHSL